MLCQQTLVKDPCSGVLYTYFSNDRIFSQRVWGHQENRNEVKASLRRKLTAMSSEKKRQQDSALLEMGSAKKAKK